MLQYGATLDLRWLPATYDVCKSNTDQTMDTTMISAIGKVFSTDALITRNKSS